jgi:zinc D-Ala-D-Ala dipeptidase
MGTDFDYFGNLAYPFCEPQLVREGKLTIEQVENRKVLRLAMKKAAFSNVPYEWWHFNAYSRNIATSKYQRID